MRAVRKLCNVGAHPNIVPVLRLGEFTEASYYFIDMELCGLNLERYIHRDWTPTLQTQMPFFTADFPPRMRMSQVWEIMEGITNGVAFIHENKEIHRDSEPRNGI